MSFRESFIIKRLTRPRFGIGATAGPLLGGVFTDLVTWRWCFYFNLPVGGATVVAMIFLFNPPKRQMMGTSFLRRVSELDVVGTMLLLGAFIMLFLGLQYTEELVPWGSPKVIGLLVGCGVTFFLFWVWQWWKQEAALLPPRIMSQRSIAAACAMSFGIYSALLIHSYYLAIWFQAVKGASAIRSGVNIIPYVAGNSLFSVIAGIYVSKNGPFIVPCVLGSAVAAVGCGFLTTLTPDTATGRWVGFEFLASFGLGAVIQQGFTAVQIILPLEDIPIGTAAIVSFQSLGGAVFVSVGNTILQNSILNGAIANAAALSGLDFRTITRAGVTGFRKLVHGDQLTIIVNLFNDGLQKVFTAAIATVGFAFFCALFLEFRNVKGKTKEKDEEAVSEKKRAPKVLEDGPQYGQVARDSREEQRREANSSRQSPTAYVEADEEVEMSEDRAERTASKKKEKEEEIRANDMTTVPEAGLGVDAAAVRQ